MSVETEIKKYVLENFLFTEDESALDVNDSFLEQGLIDSTGILEIIVFIDSNVRLGSCMY